ncbi:MAG: hypothetical protein FJY29_13560 [Betaproteobacteria bacterium]|nr:hypothetical protein [Betaproteobacteria bacterium]
MANMVKLVSLVSALGVVTGCGTAFDLDAAKNANEIVEESNNALEKQVESDETAFALSVPVAEKSKKGAIVVEKSMSLPLAYQLLAAVFPRPIGKTCLVHAGAHLINLKYSGKNEFSAEVSYPKGLKISLNRKSCKQGELIEVRAGSDFRGLAIVTNKQATYFQKELTYVPFPSEPRNDLAPLPKLQPGAIEGSDAQIGGVTTVTTPSKPPKPPAESEQCSVRSGRQNIRLHASKERSYISGTAVAASKVMNKIYIFGECNFGEKLLADTVSLGQALGYDLNVPFVPMAGDSVILRTEVELGKKDAEQL